jgi:glycosyltransferase involved in cell wall biosynthesis
VRAALNRFARQSTTEPTLRRRVLLFTNSVALGGMEEHVRLIARYLDREQFEVFTITPDWEPTRAFSEMMERESDQSTTLTPDARAGRLRQFREALRLYRQVRAWRPDVAHLHCTTFVGQGLAIMAIRLAGVPSVYVTEHLAPDGRVPVFRRVVRNALTRCFTGVVCVSEKNQASRAAWLYTPADRTVVVENGVDVEQFDTVPADELDALRETIGLPRDARVVGTAVRFEPEKGLDDLIAAFAMVSARFEDVHLLLVGDGSLRAELEAQTAALGLAPRTHFVGFQKAPRPFLGLIDVFVLPVPFGSMSIGLLEALAMRCVPVMTFGGEGEAVVHGVSGFCAEPRNPASIARFVDEVLSDRVGAKEMGEAARRRVEETFSARRVARLLGRLYVDGPRELLASERPMPVAVGPR